mgnify:CR=1 FL=1
MPNHPAQANDPFKGIKSGSWSKYGGGRRDGLIRSVDTVWACQCCAEKQPKDFPGFFVKDEVTSEYLKLCAKCYKKAKTVHFSVRQVLIRVRKPSAWYLDDEIKNLLTAWEFG